MSFYVPTLAEANEYVRRKEERFAFVRAMVQSRALVQQIWLESDEYKATLKAQRLQERQRKVREALERKANEERKKKLEAEREARRAAYQKAEEENVACEQRARRSRIDWSELIDNPVTVDRQIMWERATTALAMRKAGLTYREIGERIRLSKGRAQQLVRSALSRKPDAVSPAEAFMNAEFHKEVMDLIPRKVAVVRALEPVRYEITSDWVLSVGSGG